jgi:hypothetical protein
MKKVKYIFLLFFLCLMIAGILIGENSIIFKKAVSVCLSCIGIG